MLDNMLRLTIISILIALAVARTPRVRPVVPMLDGRIVGGEPTTIEDLPYQLSYQYFGSHICGASIISENKALTAAHCTDGFSASYLSVRAGSTYKGTGGQVVKVASVCQHPRYNSRLIDNDVSVLLLASSLALGSGVQPVGLVELGIPPSPGVVATVSGWGTTSSGGSSPSQLQKVDVPRVSQSDCKDSYEPRGYDITDQMICFGFTAGGKDSCQGDSGGPLVANGKQVGVVSWGLGCAAAGYPGVYADLSSTSIRNHVDSC